MHTYSFDKELRTKTAVIIFGLAMVASILFNKLFSGLYGYIVSWVKGSNVEGVVDLLAWLDVTPNFLGVPIWYGLFTSCYDKWLWKMWPFTKWHKIPDMNGEWVGTLTSSYDNQSISMRMIIEQSWSKISFKSVFEDTHSSSYSNVAAIRVDGNEGIRIYFGFRNESQDVEQRMQLYDGYNVLTLVDKDHIQARYFNDRNNPDPNCRGGNRGVFELTRE